jgi:hypothetical protein
MSSSTLVRMENRECNKCLKRLERVKGIEPSYSAWKAAALPLSYTRLLAINYHAGPAASTVMRRTRDLARYRRESTDNRLEGLAGRPRCLNIVRFPAYIGVSVNQRKEVIQCLLSSAVTSLGSPAKLVLGFAKGALSAWSSECKDWGATGKPAAPFACRRAASDCPSLDRPSRRPSPRPVSLQPE